MLLRFFILFTDYTFLYHVTPSRVRLRSPFPFHFCTLVTHSDSFSSFPLMLDSYGLTVTPTLYRV